MSNNTCCVLLLMKLDASDQKMCCMTLLASYYTVNLEQGHLKTGKIKVEIPQLQN